MWRVAYRFFAGMMIAVLPINFIAVYLLHDVDQDQVGHLNLAFFGLFEEFAIFSLVVVGLLIFFLWCGRIILRMQVRANSTLPLIMGALVIVVQYAIEIAGRLLLPSLPDTVRTLYLLLSPLFCAVFLLKKSQIKTAQPALLS
jgi:hypothetical protein